MSKVRIENIVIENPKDMFLSNINVEIIFEILETITEGSIKRVEIHGHLCWLSR